MASTTINNKDQLQFCLVHLDSKQFSSDTTHQVDELISIDAITCGTSIAVAVFQIREYNVAQPS